MMEQVKESREIILNKSQQQFYRQPGNDAAIRPSQRDTSDTSSGDRLDPLLNKSNGFRANNHFQPLPNKMNLDRQ